MLRLLRQKCRIFVERSMMPCLESLVNACSQLKGDLSKGLAANPSCLAGSGTGGAGSVNVCSVLRQVQVRNYSKKADKADDDNCGAPKECGEKAEAAKGCGPPHFKGSICDMGKKKPKKKAVEKKKKGGKPKGPRRFISMWDIPGCEYEPKCDVPVRSDIAHYRISDKEARDYQVTWVECPRLVIKPKKVCIHQKHPRPKRCRRQRKSVAATARPSMPMLNPMKCKEPEAQGTCPHWTMPCCKPGRIPPSCQRVRRLTPCKKRRAPYPSFSECKHEELTRGPPVECLCLRVPMACEVWAEVRRRIARGKNAVPKCGEL